MYENNKVNVFTFICFVLILCLSVTGLMLYYFDREEKKEEVRKVYTYSSANLLLISIARKKEDGDYSEEFLQSDSTKTLLDMKMDDYYLSIISSTGEDFIFNQANDGLLTMKEVIEQLELITSTYRYSHEKDLQNRKDKILEYSTHHK